MAPEDKEWVHYHGSGHYQNDGVDPHEEQHLELPEINKRKIENNHYDIIENRFMIAGACVLAISVTVGSFIVLDKKMEVSIHECEDRLYEKITGNKIHRDLFEEE